MATTPSRRPWITPALVVVVALGLLGIVWSARNDGGRDGREASATVPATETEGQARESSDATSAPAATPAVGSAAPGADAAWPARRIADDPVAVGDVDAPVVMVEYADFQCPFCGRFAREVLPVIHDEYVDQGLVRVEWRDLPILGQESARAALAGRAAARQGKFWEYYEAVYAVEIRPNTGALDDARLREIAQEIGLDMERFEQDWSDPALIPEIQADVDEAISINFSSTPSFVIGNEAVVGGQPVAVFREAIDRALAAAEPE